MCILYYTGDHSTPVEYGDHSAEPVPFSIAAVRDVVKHLDNVCPPPHPPFELAIVERVCPHVRSHTKLKYVCMYVYMYVYVKLYMYVYMYVYV